MAVALLEPVSDVEGLRDFALDRGDAWPAFFVVLLGAVALVWGARQRRRAIAALGNHELVRRLVGTVHHGRRWAQGILVCLAIACICAALLGPQYGGTAKAVPASGLDVVVAVDYSKSMLAQDVYPTRSERLEVELARFLDDARKRGDRVGVVVFAGAARGFPITSDMRVLKTYLAKADPRTEQPGGTAIGRALKLSLQFLVDARVGDADDAVIVTEKTPFAEPEIDPTKVPPPENDQAIIVLTDGEDTESRPLEVARDAATLGVRVYTVGIGSKSGEPIRKFDERGEPAGYVTDEKGEYVMTRLDEDLLTKIAELTNGRYVRVDPDDFGLDEVRTMLEELSRSRRSVTIEITREEGYAFFAVPALVLLVLALGLPERRRRAP
ncbi:MAG TPA: VWA domain-containing protein [Nannocystaceae bacterium]|nr:VWA domain-containing protein [Nannocystaceae bacterium]